MLDFDDFPGEALPSLRSEREVEGAEGGERVGTGIDI